MDITANLKSLKETVDKYKAEIDGLNTQIAKYLADRTEYDRQYNEKIRDKEYENAKYLRGKTNEADVIVDNLTAILKLKQKQYEDALQAYTNALTNLTPEQKDQIKSEQNLADLEAKAKLLKAGTTKYVIFGAIALVIVVIGVIVLRKRFN